jgi:hypothetical protein
MKEVIGRSLGLQRDLALHGSFAPNSDAMLELALIGKSMPGRGEP